ncbi:IspD/TarI family cytidylyltransferase [Spiroplasma monobiae]|uniref:2-C-methyl-D-erythritol 4-phosphate cytidylyltransferase n=1 Tax=Spiroplasma monobiae MQ-1 TaxID=1336748 RepID=A0A2K9LT67_SPISQ|nr:IspD/TarI family cytidylyltransferase [Spiroplasma monobiae]AUM62273.1 2-C-methyl-D-erythritol 4-phosphate cytidylyltransferase [Spiroplasma monobiae MQ-1]
MVSLIIVANGSGQRFGENKMLAKINNEYLINETIKCFENLNEIQEIIVVSNLEIFEIIKNKDAILVEGGKTRGESVKKGLELATKDFVLIHDGARPFVSKETILEIIDNLNENDSVIPTLKVTNCLKRIVGNKIETVNREEYFQTQTPQGFKTKIIKDQYNENQNDFFDDCQLIEKLNYKIKFIEGDEKNKKITFKRDL